MANDDTADIFVAKPTGALDDQQAALAAAHAQALAELAALRERASAEAQPSVDDNADYSMHDVPGLGRYVIPRRTGWQALLDIIHDPVPNIDFSANIYPAFDGVIGEHFQSPYLLDPLDNKYMSYESLRDNLAAVRNFLMESYYATDASGMSTAQARQAMDEIAAFVGDGLYNNFLFGGIIPNHDPNKPHINLKEASAKHGAGAQYIYECILAHNRQSSWLRPFEAVIALFGGKPIPDWKLPDASKTHFTDMFDKDIATTQVSGNPNLDEIAAAIAAATANVNAIQARMQELREQKALTNCAIDLENIGNHLIYTATHMNGVAQMSEPARRDAVEIAKDILRKLKVKIGERDTTQDLRLNPTDDVAAMGGIKGVATVYERLLAWARNNNDSAIFQHPSVIAATNAIGQMGYIAKLEALRMAQAAKNTNLATNIAEQMKRLPASFAPRQGTKLSSLLDTIQSGMETILNRTQQVGVDGGQIGHSLDGHPGGAMNSVPVAGIGNQVGVNDAAQRNQQAATADNLAAQAQAQAINSQMAAQARQQSNQGQQQAPAQPAPARSSVGRQSLNAAKAQKQQAASVSTAKVTNTTPLNPGQQQAMNRSATNAALAQAARERAEHEHHEHEAQVRAQLAQQKVQNAKAQAKAAAAKIDPSMLKGFSMKGVTGAPITGGKPIDPKSIQASMNRAPAAPAPVKPQAGEVKPVDPEQPQQTLNAPMPPRGHGGRGY